MSVNEIYEELEIQILYFLTLFVEFDKHTCLITLQSVSFTETGTLFIL